jgi:acetyl-CoA C-acetyltransferase
MDSVVIIGAVRTPLGAFNGKLKSVSAVDLGANVVKKIIEEYEIKIDSVYMGCVLSANLGQSPARQVAIKAGLDKSVNCINVNKICGSGMASVMMAKNAILAGEESVAIAGGMESMTNAPYLLEKARFGYRFGDGAIIDHMLRDGLQDAYEKCVMGYYAEDTATQYFLTREDQDEYTMKSFFKARQTIEDGFFQNEIVPILTEEKGGGFVIDTDEIPFSVDMAKMHKLKPSFKADGTITAASASSISDGAAAILIMRESRAMQLKLRPLARIVAQSCFSISPRQFAPAPIGAIKQVLTKSNWSLNEVDLFEINEAFAAVVMAATKELSLDPDKINIFGGACALGHPIGASGTRIIVTLLNALRVRNASKGIATLCVGGGEGVAMSFEML